MSMTIEQAQRITDLRVRMAANVRDGKPAHEGITTEDYAEVLSAIRGNRAVAVAAGIAKASGKGTGRGKKAVEAALATPPSKPTDPKFDKFRKFNFD
jgi:hypothetical protein